VTGAVDHEIRRLGRALMRRRPRRGGGRQVEVEVTGLGGRGDGLGEVDGRPLFVAGALPGDRVRVRFTGERAGGLKGEILELLEEGPGRVAPPCPHFGPCGGCSLQHLEDARYAAWKQQQLTQALARRGLACNDVAPLHRVAPGSRRRVSLAARRVGDEVLLGFHERERHRVVQVARCLLATSEINAVLEPLRALLGTLLAPGEAAQVAVLSSETGLDLLLALAEAPDLAGLERLAGFAREVDAARVSWSAGGGEPVPAAVARAPRLSFGRVAVTPAPGGFVQPTPEGEALLRDWVLGFLDGLPEPGAAKVADLYAGCGTFGFPLAERARVHCVEGDGPALAAAEAAARSAGLAGRMGFERRDLARRPLSARELAGFDAVVFDPPRAGAREQAGELAAARVPLVVAVSCNPNTFSRDARVLVEAGYRLEAVRSLDQFPWSGHLELVARLTCPG
jgi:23S rRNA (uracil1939-C5)-methyltransferase